MEPKSQTKGGKMVPMGIKRKDLHEKDSLATPASEKEYDNQLVEPELHLDGAHAEMMGAEDLKAGDEVQQMCHWRVKELTKTENNGKVDYRMTLCLVKAGDHVECAASDKEGEDAADGEDSPAMSFIKGHAVAGE